MPFFKYTARDKSGKSIDEVGEAISQEELVKTLQSKDLFVVSISLASEKKSHKKSRRRRHYHRGLRTNDLIMFSVEMATLLNAGVTIIKSLDILCKQIESKTLLRAIEQIKKDVEGGYTFSNALQKHEKIFSPFWINMAQTGEASGRLPLSLEQLAIYLEEKAALKKKVVSAMIYPVILMCVSVGAIAVFLIKIIPVFSDIFKGVDVELPLLTQAVIRLSDIVRKYFLIVIGSGMALFFVLKKYVSTGIGRLQYDRLKLDLPLLGPLVREIITQRFSSSLSTLLKSGVPVLHALEISEKTADNKIMEQSVKDIKAGVKEGKGMAQMMEDDELFAPLVVQMIGVGEEIGEVGKMLEKISIFYKERVNIFVGRLTTMFEPIALIVMGVVVGVLVVAMFLPIFNLSSAIR